MRIALFRSCKKRAGRYLPALVAACYLCAALLLFYSAGVLPTAATNLPLSGQTFVVDAGHGGTDGGAVGENGTVEAPLNLSVALFLAEELRKQGAEVLLTRTGPGAIAATKKEDMALRQAIMGTEGVTASVSIHMNKHTEPKPNGPRVFYQEGSEPSHLLALALQNALDDATGRERKTPVSGDYMVLNTQNTSVIVECGFLSNPEEEALLQTEDYQKLLARTIAAALSRYYGVTVDFAPAAQES